MAKKRMSTTQVTDSDEFVSMASSSQALWWHLNGSADDDGFNNQVQMAMYKAHASIDDLKVLLAKRFIIQFESGVIVIKHFKMANAIRKDRYTPTVFQEELKQLGIKDNGSYTLDDKWLPSGCQMVATGKDSIGKKSKDKNTYGSFKNVHLTDDEREKLEKEYGNKVAEELIDFLDSYIEEKGYKSKSHYLSIKRWVVNAIEEDRNKKSKQEQVKFQRVDIVPDYNSSINNEVDTSCLDEFLKGRENNG